MGTVGLGGEVERNMLLSNQARPNPGPQMLIQEPGHIPRADVFPTLQKPTGQYGYGIRMCLDQICHHFRELDLILERVDLPLLVGEQSGEGVDIVVVDAGDVRVGDDDEGEVAEGLDSVGEADRQQREGEVRGGEQSGCGEWGTAVLDEICQCQRM